MSRIHIWFFDVGQGQSSLVISDAGDECLVVDCGPGAQSHIDLHASGASLRLLVVTHLDMDHCSDLMRIVRNCNPETVRLNLDTAWKQDSQAPKLRALIRGLTDWSNAQHSPRWLSANVETPPSTPAIAGVEWRILAPHQADLGAAHITGNRNVASVVLSLNANETTVLYTGDTKDSVLARIADGQDAESLEADVLVVPHHGGRWQSDPPQMTLEALYDLVRPSVAVFSVGSGNRYEHPRSDTLREPSERMSTRVMCTQVTGKCHAASTVRAAGPGLSCAGSIKVSVSEDAFEVEPSLGAHDATIDGWDTPVCRQ